MNVESDGETGNAAKWAQDFGLDLGLRPLAERRVPDALAARFEQLIAEGRLVPGERFPPERELAVLFNVSRSTMREALNQLVLKGLIHRRPGRGTIVLDREASIHNTTLRALQDVGADLSDALDFRAVIEPAIAAQAARRATPADILRLEELIRFMDAESSAASFAAFDRQFHELIARSCGNPLLVRLSELAAEWIQATRHRALQTGARRELSRKGHRKIYAAIADGNGEAAAAAMAQHLTDVVTVLSERGSEQEIE